MITKSIENSLFEDLIGQPLAVALLQAALFKARFAPAYLFAGPDGVGRKLATLRFLEGLLSNGEPSPRERRRLELGNHPDLLWVEPTFLQQGRLIPKSQAASEGFVSRSQPQIRLSQIREVSDFLARQPVEAKRGMVVIEAAEAMHEAASNALLKTLEEPGKGLIILLSNGPERLLSTIRSRCQLVLFSRLDADSLHSVLHRHGQEDKASFLLGQHELLALAGGSPGALIAHHQIWLSIPEQFWERIDYLPTKPMEALALARDITESLDGSQQLWIIDWWQQHLWLKNTDSRPLKRLEKLRFQLLSYVQPRLAWELALLELIPFS